MVVPQLVARVRASFGDASFGALSASVVLLAALASATSASAQTPAPPAPPAATAPASECTIDLRLAGQMADVVSNALTRGLRVEAYQVRGFLADAQKRFANGQEVLAAAAKHFAIDEAKLAAQVERFRHCNCYHEGGELHGQPRAGEAAEVNVRELVAVSPFAADVVLHVVLHELGHALVREFDLPILGNEETMADAFATHYLTAQLPDRAAAVLEARVRSLMLEAGDVPRDQWPVRGEHDNDARRAFQIAALAVAADPVKYSGVGKAVAMSGMDVQRAKDYGAEIHRSWRRILAPLWTTDGKPSKEARVVCDDGLELAAQPGADALLPELEAIVRRFDWHSQVTIRFAPGDGGASWSRGTRSITVHAGYLRRFVEQGKRSSG